MTPLADLQGRMHAALIDPAADPAAPAALFRSGGRLDPAAGLRIYQRGYFLRIAACMREQFPALCHALGRDLFDDFVADYIRDCPPARHTLYDLGRRFPAWLEANCPEPEAAAPWVAFMIDLARFEYAVFAMFDAPGHEGQAYATRDTPDAALRLQPAFALGSYRFPVAAFYHAVRRGECPPIPAPAPGAHRVALVRTDYRTRTVSLSEVQHALLEQLADGVAIDAALATVTTRFGLEPSEVQRSWSGPQGCRTHWIEWGFFRDARAPSERASA